MKMIRHITLFVIITAASWAFGATSDEAFEATISSWEGALGSTKTTDFARLEGAWLQLPDSKKEAAWPQMALAYVDQSERILAAQNPTDAARYLASAGRLNQTFGGRLEYATKSPTTFFGRLAKLQVGITSATGSDPLAGMESYLFQRKGDEFIVARDELDPEVNGVTIDGVAESEALVQAHYFSARGGNVFLENTRWFIGPKGKIADTLSYATREVLRDEYGRYVPKALQAPVHSSSVQSNESNAPAPTGDLKQRSSLAPMSSTPTASAKPNAERESAKVEESSSRWTWIIGAILLLAVVGGALFKGNSKKL
jgi:hypothetical protein